MMKDKVHAWELMERPPVTLLASQSLQDAFQAFVYHGVQSIPILTDSGELAGILTNRKIMEKLFRESGLQDPIAKHMEQEKPRCMELNSCLCIGKELSDDIIYVCDNGKLAGVIDPITLVGWYRWRVKLLERFEEKCKEYEMVFNNCYDSIYEIDGDGIVLMANPATERIIGKSPDQIIGKNIRDIVSEKIYFPSVVNAVQKQMHTATILQNVMEGNQAVVTGVPVFDRDGQLSRIITITRDVGSLIEELQRFSATKEMEELYRRLRENEQLTEEYFAALRQLRREKTEEKKITTKNRNMKLVLDMVKKVAPVDSNVLILGESGVGKDVIATMIHNISQRRQGAFVKINCGAIPGGILESELFGYESGAFTGAQKNGKIGLLEIADGGTIFLNEIGEMPLDLQVKLLQVIQDKSFIRVGGTEAKQVDIRIITATNKDLQDMVKNGIFREDLYYRLNVVPITLPPLRSRKEDIPDLVMEFLDGFNAKYQRSKQLASQTMKILLNYNWPGNVRELENLIERVVVVSKDTIIYPDDLPPELYRQGNRQTICNAGFDENSSLAEVVEAVEKQVLQAAYQKYNSTNKVAEILKVNQSTIVRKLNKYKMESER